MFLEQGPTLLVIAFIPRSGSNYVCDMLRRTGLASPLEYYYPYDFGDRSTYWHNITDGDRIDKGLVSDRNKWFEYVVGNGAVKMTWQSHEVMRQEASELLNKVQLKYLYLRRHDKLRQAISWVRAEQSGRWTSLDKCSHTCCYDRESIEQRLIDIADVETRWGRFLDKVTHVDIFYEDINYDIVTIVEQLIGKKRDHDYWDTHKKIMSQYSILRDDETEKWVDYFIGS